MDQGHRLLALDPARFMDRARLAARAESFRSGVLVRGATLEELARYGREAGLSTRLLP